ncbi:MAG: histidine phosphatase family protein [Leptolyngbya sp. Prado105]|jgi:broad specificity phosphatase PhoE|nr:histidine phosphatase family protein [Leptolyngbya sp. Prado105]
MSKVLKLLFIRHAQSIGNIEKRMQGHGDYELSPLGRQQSEKLAKTLRTESWRPSYVYTSPLKRAVQTTEILLSYFQATHLPTTVSDLIDPDTDTLIEDEPTPRQIPVEYAAELKEFQNGIFQGLTWIEAQTRYPDLCRKLETSADWIPIPEAETLQDARARAQQFIDRIMQRHHDGDQLWIISHSWILQHLIAQLLGSDRSWRLRAHNTALFEFWVDRSRWELQNQNRFNTDLWQIRRFNDSRHLH